MLTRYLTLLAFLAASCTSLEVAPEETNEDVGADARLVPYGWANAEMLTTPLGDDAIVAYPVVPDSWRPFLHESLPVVVVLQGGLVQASQYEDLAWELAHYGFVVVVPNHLRALAPGAPAVPFTEGSVVADGLDVAVLLDGKVDSPIEHLVDPSKLAIVGHSFGGAVGLSLIGGTCAPPLCSAPTQAPPELLAAAFYGTHMVQPGASAVTDVDTHGVGVALLRGTQDGVASATNVESTFDILDDSRALITLDGANHFSITVDSAPQGAQPDPTAALLPQGEGNARIAAWMGLWLRRELENDPLAALWLEVFRGTLDGSVVVDRID